MLRWGFLLLLLLFSTAVAASADSLTQREWMEQLSDSLGWGYGLPDDPVADDYIALLSGERTLQVEAEENHRRSDRVAIKRLTNYGMYSGSGWVSGRKEIVDLHIAVLIPHNGRYQLSAATRLPGVKFAVAGQEFAATAGNRFTYQALGEVNLLAGPTEILVTLPPNAGIDYLRLFAPPLPSIAPLQGWQPEHRLDAADLALTTLQALDLVATLPLSGQKQTFEAESAVQQEGVEVTNDRHLGVPSGRAWVRARHLATTWQLPLSLSQPGCYQLVLRGRSHEPIQIALPGILVGQVEFGQALTNHSFGNFCLPQGEQVFVFDLPPWAGIDSLELHELDISQATVIRLLGLSAGQTAVDRQVINEILQLLSSLTH